jgi:hypothetical protein
MTLRKYATLVLRVAIAALAAHALPACGKQDPPAADYSALSTDSDVALRDSNERLATEDSGKVAALLRTEADFERATRTHRAEGCDSGLC